MQRLTAATGFLPMESLRVLLHYDAGPRWREQLASLTESGIYVQCCAELDDGTFYGLLPEADVLWHLLRPITAADIAKGTKLRLIQKIGVGTNTIDKEAAQSKGIAVCNMPGTNSRAVAEL